jgi:hypothetical protein
MRQDGHNGGKRNLSGLIILGHDLFSQADCRLDAPNWKCDTSLGLASAWLYMAKGAFRQGDQTNEWLLE